MLNMFAEMDNLLVFTTLNVVPMGAQIECSVCGHNVLSSQFFTLYVLKLWLVALMACIL